MPRAKDSSSRPTIVSVGEFLWDCFPTGKRLGGAPANLACHAAGLGADAYVISAVGRDDLGDQALSELSAKGVNTSHITRHDYYPTGTSDISFTAEGDHRFVVNSPAAWDHLSITDEKLELISRADVIIFGTLGQRSVEGRAATRRLIEAAGPQTIRLCDANFRPPFDDHDLLRDLLSVTDILKINEEELHHFAPQDTPESFFSSDPQLSHLIYTRGENGALLLDRENSSDHPGIPTEVVDTVGAGDSFTATFLTGLLKGQSLDTINRHAIEIAAYVCSQSGATPDLPELLSAQ